jgi:type VI secretion system Hcp family effector
MPDYRARRLTPADPSVLLGSVVVFSRRSPAKFLVPTAAAVVAAGAVAIAAIPGGGGVITACWDHNTDTAHFGTLRVIDPSLASVSGHASYEYSCQASETQITWNQQGPIGPVGPAGDQGPAGPQAPSTALAFQARGSRMFLDIPGAGGEIDIQDVSLTVGRDAASGQATGRRTHGAILVTKKVDKSSPNLFRFAATGKHFQKVSISARKAGKGQHEYLVIKLSDCIITSVKQTNPPKGQPVEQISLSFSKLQQSYRGNQPSSITLVPGQLSAK